MERSELPLSWRDRSALAHMLSGGAKVDPMRFFLPELVLATGREGGKGRESPGGT